MLCGIDIADPVLRVPQGIVDKLGSRLAFTRVEIRRERDDALIVTAIHTKFVG